MNAKNSIINTTSKHIFIKLTLEQAIQLWSLARAANQDGDHRDWLKSAGASPANLRALNEAMEIVGEASDAARWRRANDLARRKREEGK